MVPSEYRLDQVAARLTERLESTRRSYAGDPEGAAYWLRQWIDVYSWLADHAPPQAVFVCYEELCDDPAIWAGLAARIDIDPSRDADGFRRGATRAGSGDAPEALLTEADALYLRLRERAARI